MQMNHPMCMIDWTEKTWSNVKYKIDYDILCRLDKLHQEENCIITDKLKDDDVKMEEPNADDEKKENIKDTSQKPPVQDNDTTDIFDERLLSEAAKIQISYQIIQVKHMIYK